MKQHRLQIFALLLSILLLLSSCSLIGLEDPLPTPSASIAEESKTPTGGTTTENNPSQSTPATENTPPLSPECKHSFDTVEISKQATCSEEGLQTSICSKCGGKTVAVLEKLAHTPVANQDIEATCQTTGKTGGTHCKVCLIELTPATTTLPLSHHFSDGICTACGKREGSAEGLAYLSLYNSTYGYDYLGTMSKGEARQTLYTRIDQAVRLFHTNPALTAEKKDTVFVACTVNYDDLGLQDSEALEVWKTYRDDNPLYYWISNRITYSPAYINVLAVDAYADGAARIAQNQVLYETIASYLALVPANADSYATALILHDTLINAIDYALDENDQPEDAHWAHSIVGVFTAKGAVCEGFAKAYQLLMNLCEEEILYVSGYGNGEAHAWNVICIEGTWYGVDVTWDDNNEETYPYLYFCLSDAEFSKSHTEDLPSTTGLNFLYAIPTLAEFNLEWVELYKDETYLGLYENFHAAFNAMTDENGNYKIMLCTKGVSAEGVRLHITAKYRILDPLPDVASLTMIGTHQITENNNFTATLLYLTQDTVLQSDLTLKSIFLTAETDVTLKTGAYTLTARTDTVYYSYVLPDHITVVK